MPNYDEMDELLKSVKEYVDKLKSLAEVEESLKGYDADFEDISKRCDNLINKTKEYVDSASSLDTKYSNIDTNIGNVLNQYQNVLTSYDATRFKLDAFDTKQSEVADNINAIKAMVSDFEKAVGNDSEAISKIDQKLEKYNYTTIIMLGVLIALVAILIVIGVFALVMLS